MNFLNELKDLKKISEVTLYLSLALSPLTIIFSLITGSVTLLVYFIWAVAAIIVRFFALLSIRIMLKENQFMFPYGTGKMENFSSFFFGFIIVPIGIYFLVISTGNLIHPLPGVTYLLCMIPPAISFFRSLFLTLWTRRTIRRSSNPSPILKAYYVDFKVSLTSDSFLFISFLAGFLLSVAGIDFLSIRVDPMLTLILSLFMLRVGLPLIIENTRSLLDLPLPEKDMLKILKIATEFSAEYSGFGMLFSRQSGKQKIIEMELLFDPGISLEKVNEVESQMAEKMKLAIPDVRFRLIPKILSTKD